MKITIRNNQELQSGKFYLIKKGKSDKEILIYYNEHGIDYNVLKIVNYIATGGWDRYGDIKDDITVIREITEITVK